MRQKTERWSIAQTAAATQRRVRQAEAVRPRWSLIRNGVVCNLKCDSALWVKIGKAESNYFYDPNNHTFSSRRQSGKTHEEHWIPAEDLEEFNRNIVGKIKVIAEFKGE